MAEYVFTKVVSLDLGERFRRSVVRGTVALVMRRPEADHRTEHPVLTRGGERDSGGLRPPGGRVREGELARKRVPYRGTARRNWRV